MGGIWFNSNMGMPGRPDPQTVLRNYMNEHNCSESEAKAALEQKYGRPGMPGMPGMVNGNIDMTFNPSQMSQGMPVMPPMPEFMQAFMMPGITPNGSIDFSYRQNSTQTSSTTSTSTSTSTSNTTASSEFKSGTKEYYSQLAHERYLNRKNIPASEREALSAEVKGYKNEVKQWTKELKHQLDVELKSIKRDNYSSRKEYTAAKKAVKEAFKNNLEANIKAKLLEKYPDKDVDAIMYNVKLSNSSWQGLAYVPIDTLKS